MIIRWTPAALRDLESLHEYVAEDNLPAAAATVERILSGIEALSRHPDMGRKGRIPDTRELIISPYIVVYRTKAAALDLLAIIHSARRWPDSF
jgi:addiction module RelE/StbE family toxin